MKKLQKFAIHNNTVHPFITQEGQVLDQVPAGYYVVKESLFGYYLENKSSELKLPTTIYGTTVSRADRIWNTFDLKDQAIAVGLFGSKGAGKTLLANVIAQQGIERNLPVIDVSGSFVTNTAYLEFLNSIGNCVIIFDEFLKRLSKTGGDEDVDARQVSREKQDDMLTFFQGTNNANRLVILIDNNSAYLSEFFRDRPGRMRYHFNYTGVTSDVVEAIGQNSKLTRDKIDMLITYSKRFSCTFDMINEIVFEWANYPDETLESLTEIMNVPTLRPLTTMKVKIVSFEPGTTGLVLDNELADMDSDGDITLKMSIASPFYGMPDMTHEQFHESPLSNDEYNYSEFCKYRTVQRIERQWDVRDRDLVAIRNGQSTYDVNGIRVVVENLVTTSTSRFDFSGYPVTYVE